MSVMSTLARRGFDYHDPRSLGSRLRRRRLAPLIAMIDRVFRDHGKVDLIDIGGTRSYWEMVGLQMLRARNVHVTVVNLPDTAMPPDDSLFSFVAADACDLSIFPDRSFHIAHSNSVIEHVGDWARMMSFSRELARIAERFFVQTPNYWFPIEPHAMTPFLHWSPKPFRIWLIRNFDLGHWPKQDTIDAAVRTVESARLLTRGMLQELFPEATILTERVLLLPKSHVAIKR